MLFLLYHYFAAAEMYNMIRVLIAAYVWMTGFNNFLYYYKSNDFSIVRCAPLPAKGCTERSSMRRGYSRSLQVRIQSMKCKAWGLQYRGAPRQITRVCLFASAKPTGLSRTCRMCAPPLQATPAATMP